MMSVFTILWIVSMGVDWLNHRLRSLRKQVIRQPLSLKEANDKIVQVNKETEEELLGYEIELVALEEISLFHIRHVQFDLGYLLKILEQ